MLPQASQTWRGSESPGGTRDSTAPPQLEQNFIQRLYDMVGPETQPVHRRARAIDPEYGEAERFRALRVPAVGGNETDVLLWDLEFFYRQLIDSGIGFVGPESVDAQNGIETQFRLRHQRIEHVRRAVAQDGQLSTGKSLESPGYLGEERKLPVLGQ